ncbi:MAG: gamma-glutamyltransferase [Mariprofundaceae bacterium]|nr:gamma-glutamyltransferase [Mariprofundaceae bacterium]
MAVASGCVAAGHKATAEAGADILRAGGNAVDAAIAAVCMSFIAEPVLTGAGGGGFLLLRQPDGKSVLFDGFVRMPKHRIEAVEEPDFRAIPVDFGDTVQTFHTGRAAIGTPTLMALLFEAHRSHGRIPMGEVIAPAIHAAREGVRLNTLQSSFIHLLESILTSETACRRLHAPEGHLLKEGELFKNADLANLLELLVIGGVDEMYHGDVAQCIADACCPGGLLSKHDLEQVEAIRRKPLSISTLGGQLLTNPPPSSGGCLMGFSFMLLDQLVKSGRHEPLNILLAECLHAASHVRSTDFDKQVHEAGIEQQFLSESNVNNSFNKIIQHIDYKKKSTYSEIENRHGSTTHISVLDKEGQVVSVTTSNGEGSGIVAPGTGIHLNNMLGEEDINPLGFHRLPAGETLSSMMAPSIFIRNGLPALILGSGGSNRLRSAIFQVLCRHMLQDMDIETAVHFPRLHNEGEVLENEPGCFSPDEEHTLSELGWNIRHWQQPSVYFGGVHAIALDAKGQTQAAGDPRRGGAVAWA